MNLLNKKINITMSARSVLALSSTLLVCIFVVLGTFNNVFSYLGLALAAISIVFFPQEDVLCLFMFIMPFANIFKNAPDAQSFFTYLTLFYVVYKFVRARHTNVKFIFAFLVMCTFLLLQMLISVSMLRIIKFVANILFVYFVVDHEQYSDNNKKIYMYFIYGVVLSSIIVTVGIIPNLVDYVGIKDLGGAYDQLERFSGMYVDPNHYSINLIISLCLIIILNGRKQLKLGPSILLSIVLVAFSIMTFSKSAFLMLFLPLIMLLYVKIKSGKYLIFVCLLFAIVFVSLSVLAGRIEAFDIILSRFSDADDVNSLTTGRTDIWLNYLEHFTDSGLQLIFGGGFGAKVVEGHAAHNTYIDLIHFLGILGTAIFVAILRILAKIGEKAHIKNFLNHSVWICVLIMYFFLSKLFYFDWPFHIAIAILVSRTNLSN